MIDHRTSLFYDKTKAISPGLYLSGYCEICGKLKRSKNHDRCSKIKQKKFVK
jgi:hypothetical protein